jgi:hypothetical protein
MMVMWVWLVIVLLAIVWLAGLTFGFRKGREREEKSQLLFVALGPHTFEVAGNIIRLADGELFECRMWKRGDHKIGRGRAIDVDPSSPTYDDPETFKPSKL